MPHKTYHLPIVTIVLSFMLILLLVSYNHSYKRNNNYDDYNIVPEYNRQMKNIVISLDMKNVSLGLHSELLSLLPEYTEILVLLPNNSLEKIKDEIKYQPYMDRIKFIGFNTEHLENANVYLLFPEKDKFISGSPIDIVMPQGSLWAQDLFETAVNSEGHIMLLVSDLHKWFVSNNGKDPYQVISDNAYIGNMLSADMNVKRLPVTFKGGNILIDVLDDKRIAFCGGDLLRQTKTVWKSTRGKTLTDDEIIVMLKQHLNVDEVIVIGREKEQPSLMFHLDQAMTILPDKVALITNIVNDDKKGAIESDEIKDVKRFISSLRSTLENLGYRIVSIDTSTDNAINFQYYVNGIPFINKYTGQRVFYMPVFATSQTQVNKANINRNIAAIEKLKYEVIKVNTNADKIHGGIHCLFNVIS